MPHERLQETVCAYVIPQIGHSIDVDSIAAFLSKSGLAKQKFPERVELVEDLPRTASGKVQRICCGRGLRRPWDVKRRSRRRSIPNAEVQRALIDDLGSGSKR